MSSDACSIRPARPGDESAIHALVRELAEFERLLDQVVSTPADLATAMFGNPPRLHALIAEVDGRPAGMALFHPTFSSFTGKPSLWLEDVRQLIRKILCPCPPSGYGFADCCVRSRVAECPDRCDK